MAIWGESICRANYPHIYHMESLDTPRRVIIAIMRLVGWLHVVRIDQRILAPLRRDLGSMNYQVPNEAVSGNGVCEPR